MPHLRHKSAMLHPDDISNLLMDIYERMEKQMGNLHWWPAETREEVIIGAILVQSVAWKNVESAIANLRAQALLSFFALYGASADEIEPLIRSTLYFRMKTKKLKAFANHLHIAHSGDLMAMLTQPMPALRAELLQIYGIGQETADDIILYAANQPSFVIDTYTKRIFHRLGYGDDNVSYAALRQWFMDHLPANAPLFNQYHALIDAVGHRYCTTNQPNCTVCPLHGMCAFAASNPSDGPG